MSYYTMCERVFIISKTKRFLIFPLITMLLLFIEFRFIPDTPISRGLAIGLTAMTVGTIQYKFFTEKTGETKTK